MACQVKRVIPLQRKAARNPACSKQDEHGMYKSVAEQFICPME